MLRSYFFWKGRGIYPLPSYRYLGNAPLFTCQMFSEHLIVTVHICLLIFTFVEILFFFLVSSFFYWKDITSDFLKMLFSILVCGVPVWTCSLKIGGVSAILIKMGVFWGGGWCKSSFTHKNEIYPRTLQNK